jgi:hypothetical protein
VTPQFVRVLSSVTASLRFNLTLRHGRRIITSSRSNIERACYVPGAGQQTPTLAD